jgi:hypothetical protein
MKKKISISLLLMLAMFSLAACGSLNLPGIGQVLGQAAQTPGAFNPKQMTVEMKLAMGTLQLEKTDLAVTSEEAKQLLPLWKGVKSLGASETASQEEIQALYVQIKETMTTEQVQAIEEMDFAPEEFQALMKELGIQMPQGRPGGDQQNLTQEQRATRVAQFQGQNQGAGRQGMRPEMGQGGDPRFMLPGGAPEQGNARQTPAAGQRGSRGAMGLNSMFIDPLLKLLQERAGS